VGEGTRSIGKIREGNTGTWRLYCKERGKRKHLKGKRVIRGPGRPKPLALSSKSWKCEERKGSGGGDDTMVLMGERVTQLAR